VYALKITQAQNVDITFIDLQLGTDDGLELVDRVRHSVQDSMKFILMATTISISMRLNPWSPRRLLTCES